MKERGSPARRQQRNQTGLQELHKTWKKWKQRMKMTPPSPPLRENVWMNANVGNNLDRILNRFSPDRSIHRSVYSSIWANVRAHVTDCLSENESEVPVTTVCVHALACSPWPLPIGLNKLYQITVDNATSVSTCFHPCFSTKIGDGHANIALLYKYNMIRSCQIWL